MDSVYVETTIIGHLAGRLHPDPAIAARQRTTRDWWPTARAAYRMVISQFVVDECSAGDPEAAQERLDLLRGVELLEFNSNIEALAGKLIAGHAIPPSEPRDALHVAMAAVHGVQYLVIWNFKHIANATLRTRINEICRGNGYEPPIICTPEELAGTTDDPDDTD